jgi:hypothetical protein
MVKVMLAFPSASRPTRTRLIVFSGLPEQLGSSYTNTLQLSVCFYRSRVEIRNKEMRIQLF